MKGIGPGWVVIGGLLIVAGCSEAIHALGRLPGDAPSVDASTSDGPIGNPDASAGTGGMAGVGGVGGMGGDAGGGGTGGTLACMPRHDAVQRKGLNLYLMVDDSFAMLLQPAWGQILQAIDMFLSDPANAGLGVGINYFGTSCNARDYAAPRVAVSLLPGVAAPIRASFPPLPLGGVAASIAAAVDGAILYASTVEAADAERETDVLFITDGLFDTSCGESITEATTYAAAGLNSTPSIQTHVIAIDSGFLDPLNTVDLTPLDTLAIAGGTGQAQRVQVNLSSTMQIYEALMQAAYRAMPCEFRLPEDFDATRTVLEWRPSGSPNAPSVAWPRVVAMAACGESEAFYRSGPDHVQLCRAACATLKASTIGTLQAREDCP